ncbi:hypothetical protein INT44_003879 [Umbelopsis vinacea]|uniref:AD domain-containing protein n=1 Tax=Umbelopsis vinacea TaxID=44442 RepID=A0A8H7QAX0_9FUNG|nr:hypothetical protein INT44_003879 [Umbelopsis vinacea]
MAIPHSADVDPLLYDMTPEEIVASRGSHVTVMLSTNDTQTGYLFAIDPVSGTVILKHENKAIVLLRHHVKSIQGTDIEKHIDIQQLGSTSKTYFYLSLVNADNRLSQSQLEELLASGVGAESLKHDSAAMRRRKQQAINLLESVRQKKKRMPTKLKPAVLKKKLAFKNRVPIKYSSDEEDIVMLDSARLTPPYVPTSIQCDNSIISERISKIIQSMPPWQFQ